MNRVIWFEDQDYDIGRICADILPGLNDRLSEIGWFSDAGDIYSRDWDLSTEKELLKVENADEKQLWIIDLRCERYVPGPAAAHPEEIIRCAEWRKEKIDGLRCHYEQFEEISRASYLDEKDFSMHCGVVIAGIAASNNIPFLISSHNLGSFAKILAYMAGVSENEFKSFYVLDKLAGAKAQIDRVVGKITEEIGARKQLKDLHADEWRLIRVLDRSLRAIQIEGEKSEEYNFLNNIFGPWHMPMAVEPASESSLYHQPDKWASLLFSESTCELYRSCGYDIENLRHWGDQPPLNQPPIWQLLQDKHYPDAIDDIKKKNLLTGVLQNWVAKQAALGRRVTFVNSDPNPFGDYFWFNVFCMCDILHDFLSLPQCDNISSVKIDRIGAAKVADINSVKNGLLCSFYITEESKEGYQYNKHFPAAGPSIIYEKDMPRICRRLFRTGAKWFFYSSALEDSFNYHLLYPYNGECEIESIFPEEQNQLSAAATEYSAFAFFIEPEITATPFRNKIEDFDINKKAHRAKAVFTVKSCQGNVKLSCDGEQEMMNEALNLISGRGVDAAS